MSDQYNHLGQSSDNSSQDEDHFLNLPDQEGKPIDESGVTFGGLRLPSALEGKDLHYGENPHKPLMRAVPTPPHLGDLGVPVQMLGLEKVLKSLHISKNVCFIEPNVRVQEMGTVDHNLQL